MENKHMLTTKGTKENTIYLVYRSWKGDIEGWPSSGDSLRFITKDSSEAILFANNEWDFFSSMKEKFPDRYEALPNDMTNDIHEIAIDMDYELAWQLGMKELADDSVSYISVIKIVFPEEE